LFKGKHPTHVRELVLVHDIKTTPKKTNVAPGTSKHLPHRTESALEASEHSIPVTP